MLPHGSRVTVSPRYLTGRLADRFADTRCPPACEAVGLWASTTSPHHPVTRQFVCRGLRRARVDQEN